MNKLVIINLLLLANIIQAEAYRAPCNLRANSEWIINNMQYCAHLWGENHGYDSKKIGSDGKHDCVAENWTTDKEGKAVSKTFGWVTIKGGKRQGPAEIILDSNDREQKIKLHFEKDALHGPIIIKGQDDGECHINHNHGLIEGMQKRFNSKGEIEEATSWNSQNEQLFSIAFCPNRKIGILQCGIAPMIPEADKACGFKGEITTDVGSCNATYHEKITYTNGLVKRVLTSTQYNQMQQRAYYGTFGELPSDIPVQEILTTEKVYNPPTKLQGKYDGDERRVVKFSNGKIYSKEQYSGGSPVGVFEIFSYSGIQIKKVEFDGKGIRSYAEYYLNGTPKILVVDEKVNGESQVTIRPDPNLDEMIKGLYTDPPENYYENNRQWGVEKIKLSMEEFNGSYALQALSIYAKSRTTYLEGRIVAHQNYKVGVLDGDSEFLNLNDNLKSVVTFKDGREISAKEYNLKTNKMTSQIEYLPDGSRRKIPTKEKI